jgi:hypothetical protein
MYLSDTESLAEVAPKTRDSARFARLLRLTPKFQLLDQSSEQRGLAEACIRDKFFAAYGAEVQEYLPLLLSMQCAGKISGVTGIAPAGQQRLFLEQYLEAPVEQALAPVLGAIPARNTIVEIGNLVASSNGASLAVFIVLGAALHRAGYRHLVFTATEKLRSKFQRLGLETTYLSPADPARLEAGGADNWGSYYDHQPQVVVCNLDQAMSRISARPIFTCIAAALTGQIRLIAAQLAGQPGAEQAAEQFIAEHVVENSDEIQNGAQV